MMQNITKNSTPKELDLIKLIQKISDEYSENPDKTKKNQTLEQLEKIRRYSANPSQVSNVYQLENKTKTSEQKNKTRERLDLINSFYNAPNTAVDKRENILEHPYSNSYLLALENQILLINNKKPNQDEEFNVYEKDILGKIYENDPLGKKSEWLMPSQTNFERLKDLGRDAVLKERKYPQLDKLEIEDYFTILKENNPHSTERILNDSGITLSDLDEKERDIFNESIKQRTYFKLCEKIPLLYDVTKNSSFGEILEKTNNPKNIDNFFDIYRAKINTNDILKEMNSYDGKRGFRKHEEKIDPIMQTLNKDYRKTEKFAKKMLKNLYKEKEQEYDGNAIQRKNKKPFYENTHKAEAIRSLLDEDYRHDEFKLDDIKNSYRQTANQILNGTINVLINNYSQRRNNHVKKKIEQDPEYSDQQLKRYDRHIAYEFNKSLKKLDKYADLNHSLFKKALKDNFEHADRYSPAA